MEIQTTPQHVETKVATKTQLLVPVTYLMAALAVTSLMYSIQVLSGFNISLFR